MKKFLFVLVAIFFCGAALAGPIDNEIDNLLIDYFKIHSALANDSTTGIDAAAHAVHRKAARVEVADPEVQELLTQLKDAAKQMQGNDLEKAREHFSGLSKPLLVYLQRFHSEKERYSRYFCGMAKKGWIQSEKGTKNPYYGSAMLTCGELIQ